VMVECRSSAPYFDRLHYTLEIEFRSNNAGEWRNYREWMNLCSVKPGRLEGSDYYADAHQIEAALRLVRLEAAYYAEDARDDEAAMRCGATDERLRANTVSDEARAEHEAEETAQFWKEVRVACDGFPGHHPETLVRIVRDNLAAKHLIRPSVAQVEAFVNVVVAALDDPKGFAREYAA
jgi:hypothetical protein